MPNLTRYDTNNVSIADRFAFWRESVCDSYVQLGCEASDKNKFEGKIEIARHSALSISRVSGRAHTVERRKSDISASCDAYFLFSLQTGQSSQVSQFGQCATLLPGDMALYSSTDPYKLNLADDFSQTVVQLPAKKLIDRLPNAPMLTARSIDGQSGIGQLVRQNILAFADHISSAEPVLQALVQETLIDLIATGLASNRVEEKTELLYPEQHVMLQAKTFIRSNLGDPELDRNLVASQIGMSVRRLNEIFAKQNESISAFIRTMRLEGVAADLTDIRFAHQTISDIAFRYGFSNLQSFSTLFRAAYGSSPRAYRVKSSA